MEPEKSDRIMKLAEKMDGAAREVSFRAVRIAAGIPVDKQELRRYFGELSSNLLSLAEELGVKR